MRTFVPSEAEEGERFGDTPVVLCSELAENAGEGITKSAEKIHLAVREAFGLPEVVWIEHHGPETTDRRTETCELVVFSAGSNPSWKPLDRASVEVLVGRCLTERSTAPFSRLVGNRGARGMACRESPDAQRHTLSCYRGWAESQ